MKEDSWRIKNVQVEGLLGLHNLYWELHQKVNILGGPNGSGKSTLLHALAILLQGGSLEASASAELLLHCDTLFESISAELDSGAILTIEGREEYSRNIGLGSFAKHILYINSADQAIASISKLVEKLNPAGRPAATTLDLAIEQALNTRNQLFAQRMSIAMHEDNEEEIGRLRKLFGRFEKAVKFFMSDYTILDTSTLMFAPVCNKATKINYFQLSTGEKQLLYLLLTVCNTLGESTILLLDEADMGMHIDWKQNLLRELLNLNPNMQVIAATHSPSLIDGWYDNVKEISQLYVSSVSSKRAE